MKPGAVKRVMTPKTIDGINAFEDYYRVSAYNFVGDVLKNIWGTNLSLDMEYRTGTFGRVCLCLDRVTNKYCAIKILAMTDIIRLKQVEHIVTDFGMIELLKVLPKNSIYVEEAEWSTKDNCCLYIIFEYVCGGELFTYLRNSAMFFAAEIVLAFEYLHSLQIVYRDLKPENVLIGKDGHVKITDFGFAKKLKDRTWTLCGTPEYLAPEIIQSKGHNKAVDWWALGNGFWFLLKCFICYDKCLLYIVGILIYEMLVGYPPFYDENPFGIYEKILGGKIDWPRHIDPMAKDLIKKLLTHDRTKRLGNMKNGANDVKRHRWFKNLIWLDVYHKLLKKLYQKNLIQIEDFLYAPIVPEVQSEGDTTHFDDYPEKNWKPTRSLEQTELQLFIDF
uniref:Protein kinase domain-containing protein n=1 Tax=Glossina brevipalpis TaxID=37001 RepID=A0A1A9W508_9MUSC